MRGRTTQSGGSDINNSNVLLNFALAGLRALHKTLLLPLEHLARFKVPWSYAAAGPPRHLNMSVKLVMSTSVLEPRRGPEEDNGLDPIEASSSPCNPLGLLWLEALGWGGILLDCQLQKTNVIQQ